MSAELPQDVVRLFWDTDPAAVDLDRHRDYVMERVMSRGTWNAMLWLRRSYPRGMLAEFVLRRGQHALAPREHAYWALVTGAPVSAGPGGGRPAWAGP